jgi:hypothetical protein
MTATIFHPSYYRVIQREGTRWRVKGSLLCSEAAIGLLDIANYGLTSEQLFVSLFRINGGKPGYYLANLRTKTYYYCGLGFKNVQVTLRSLGIGREEAEGNECE